jgi:hypothetical protein
VECIQLRPAIEQAAHDAGAKLPVVCWRKNRTGWLCVLRAPDLLTILRRSDLVRTSP